MFLQGFTADDFNSAKIQKIPLNHNSQKEAVVFLDDKTLMIADEKGRMKGNVYTFPL
ncbi:hypothetical protein OWR28_09040 [Chryseobacterium sp. 1B4]